MKASHSFLAMENFKLVSQRSMISGDHSKRKHSTLQILEGIPKIVLKERLRGVGHFCLLVFHLSFYMEFVLSRGKTTVIFTFWKQRLRTEHNVESG